MAAARACSPCRESPATRRATIRQFEYEVPPGAAVILHSDGLSSRWEVAALPGLETRDPLLIAAVLLAEAGIHRDDAGVLVLKS